MKIQINKIRYDHLQFVVSCDESGQPCYPTKYHYDAYLVDKPVRSVNKQRPWLWKKAPTRQREDPT